MYQFSRAIYRELAPIVSEPPVGVEVDAYQLAVLRACERTITRMATDNLHFARPAKSLFCDIRTYFPMAAQPRVLMIVERYVGLAQRFLETHPDEAHSALTDAPPACRATTRKGSPCLRTPLPRNGYCPSHQHLARTEHRGALAA
jgi:hypothetical protein